MTRRHGSLFDEVMYHAREKSEKPGGDLFLFAHTVRGVTVISSSRTNPFPPNQPEAKRVAGSAPRGPVTAGQIAAMHKMAVHVRESYGEAAVGELPPMQAERKAEAAA
jgi:hypothetical protein